MGNVTRLCYSLVDLNGTQALVTGIGAPSTSLRNLCTGHYSTRLENSLVLLWGEGPGRGGGRVISFYSCSNYINYIGYNLVTLRFCSGVSHFSRRNRFNLGWFALSPQYKLVKFAVRRTKVFYMGNNLYNCCEFLTRWQQIIVRSKCQGEFIIN